MNKQSLTAATFLTAAMTLGQSPATALVADEATTKTHREHGIVLECRGDLDGTAVYASLYENDKYGNWFQVVLGDPDAGHGRAKNVKREILDDGLVRASITIDGAKATVRGTASKVGRKKPVHEELDDAGYRIVSDGTHRRLRNDLVFEYDGLATRLTCDPAFAYDLQVTKTPIV
jgi:hypothetical protein